MNSQLLAAQEATAVGSAKVMSYEDIVEAQKQRDMRRRRKSPRQVLGKRSRSQELEVAVARSANAFSAALASF
jgi:hypothetical protein